MSAVIPCPLTLLTVFFFLGRSRHTRLTCNWSSDECSSDLREPGPPGQDPGGPAARCRGLDVPGGRAAGAAVAGRRFANGKIGRASCRERVYISVVAVIVKNISVCVTTV